MRWIARIVALALLAVVLPACGSDGNSLATFSQWAGLFGGNEGGLGPSNYLLVSNQDGNTLSLFQIDTTTGALTPAGTIPAGSGPQGMTLSADGKYLYVANTDSFGSSWNGSGTVSVYRYSNGSLTEVVGSPFPSNTMALLNCLSPDGRFLYATNQDNFEVTAFAVGSGGSLTEIASSPTTFDEAHGIAMHPSGTLLFVGTESGTVHSSWINPADGSLTPINEFGAGEAHNWLICSPDGKFLYSGDCNNSGTGELYCYSINTSTGDLTLAPGFPLVTTASNAVKAAALTADGNFLYIAQWDSGNVYAYSVNKSTGALTLAGGPVAAGTEPKACVLDSEGKFLYVINYGSEDVSAFRVSGGSITPVGTSPAGTAPKFGIALP